MNLQKQAWAIKWYDLHTKFHEIGELVEKLLKGLRIALSLC
jgi:hypothetical protein